MEVKCHTTGDIALLNFTQRGWTSKGAYEVKGNVTDKFGRVRISIAGFWNDKLFARKVNDGENPDRPSSPPYIIWQANPRPEAPFNLTAFAITLNALNPTLNKYLPPTDTRLRPDQRAMEEGQYDFAAEEKNRLEEKQRARRNERQRNGESIHGKPRWFKKAVDKNILSGEEYWDFTGEYWKVREEIGQKRINGKEVEWPDVEDIF
jgi:oxysterol-binding protein 1